MNLLTFNTNVPMKNIIYRFVTVVSLIVVLASCAKSIENTPGQKPGNPSEESFTMKIFATNSESRTIIEESGSNYLVKWQDGDQIGVYEVANGEVLNKTNSSALDFDSGDPAVSTSATATFTLSFVGTPSGPYDYSFIYPAGALTKSGEKYRVRLNKNQTFVAGSFDPAADIMISEHVHEASERPASRSLRFARIGATARMILKAPTTFETIQTITFSTTEGNLAGYYELTPSDGTLSAIYSGDKEVVLTPAASTTWTGNQEVWFRCAAITLSDNFTVTVKTNEKTYSKVIDLASASRTLQFAEGSLTKFNVDMTEVIGTTNPSVDNGWYVLAALHASSSHYYALTSTASTTRLAASDLGTSFNPTENFETDDATIVWKVTNGDGSITLQSAASLYLNSGASAASTSASSQSFTLNEAVSGTFEINSTSHGGIRYNSSASYWGFYTSSKSVSMIGDVCFVPVTIDRTPVLSIDNISLDLSGAASNVIITPTSQKFISSITVNGVYNDSERTSDCDWATVNYSNGQLAYSVENNTSTDTRVAYVRVTGSNGEGDEQIVDFTISQAGVHSYSNEWGLLTDVSNLSEGDKIVIVNTGGTKALGTTQNANNRNGVDVSVSNNVVTINENVQQLTLGKSNGHWTFYTGSGYLYAVSSSNNYLRTRTPLGDNNAEWTISLNGSFEATITAQGSNSHNLLKNNGNLFSCYASGQTAVKIYKWYDDPSAKKIIATKSSISNVVSSGVENATLTDAYTLKNATDGDLTVTTDNSIVTSASVSSGTVTYTVATNTGATREGWINIAVDEGNDITISVSQLAAQYTLTLSGANGTVSASVGGVAKASGSAIDCGVTVTITASGNDGYTFDEWDVFKTGETSQKVTTATATSPTTFTMPAYNVTAEASFVSGGGGGGVELSSPASISISDINLAEKKFSGNWEAVANANSYDWVVSTASTSGEIADGNTKASGNTTNTSFTSATLDDSHKPVAGTVYYLYVRAIGDGVSYSTSSYGQARAIIYQHVFTAKPSTGSNITLSAINWTISATNLGNYNSNNYAGVQIGSKNNDGSITLTSSNAWGAQSSTAYYEYGTVKKVNVWANLGGTSVTPSVSIGGTSATGSGSVSKNSGAGSDWTQTSKVVFTPGTNAQSQVVNTGVVVINLSSVKAGYICAVEVLSE